METTQITGPLVKGKTYKVDIDNALFVQIGMEGSVVPLKNDDLEPDIKINGEAFRISDNHTLEWDNFAESTLTIVPLKDLDEYMIIDIAYE